MSPEALADPADGPVLVGDTVIVVCRAEQSSVAGSEAVNPERVFLQMFDENGDPVDDEPQLGVPNGNDDEYAVTFPVSGFPNGVVTFRCSAEDVSDLALTGRGESSTFLDRGPAITVVSPEQDSVYPQMGLARFEILIEPDPLTDDDEEAEVDVDSVILRVADVEIPVDEEDPGVFVANVDFTDALVFGAPLEGSVPLNVGASNLRSDPGPVTRTTGYNFIVDGEGPVVTITSPSNEQVVGGRVNLLFTVVDELANVDPASIVVRVNAERHPFNDDPPNWAIVGEDSYRFTFDSRLIENSVAQATIRIEARDVAQNAARPATLLIYLDNVPPVVDLDPTNLIEFRDPGVCSAPFDPLGVSPNDVTLQSAALRNPRAFVWEETNVTPGVTRHHAGTNEDSVYLYLLPASQGPIIDDGDDADTICDRVNPAAVPGLKLVAVPPEGSAHYTTGTTDDPPGCYYQTSDSPVERLCDNNTSDLTRVMAFDVDDEVAVVYANGSLNEPDCTGSSWEIRAFAEEGWNCLAAEATDNVGNTAVSWPLRICYDNPMTPAVPSCMNLQNPPSCIEVGSTLPRNFAATGITIVGID